MPASNTLTLTILADLTDVQIAEAARAAGEPEWMIERREAAWRFFAESLPPIWKRTDLTKFRSENIAVPLGPPNSTTCLTEPDNCAIDGSFLYSSNGFTTGITIDLDSVVPPGTYRYLRFFSATAPPDTDGGVELDAIEVLPP